MRADRACGVTAAEPATGSDGAVRRWVLLTAALVGAGLLWSAPLGGALLMVFASFALVISWEASGAAATTSSHQLSL